MKIKFLGATEAEDRIVEIPEGTTTVEVELPKAQDSTGYGPWPATVFFCVATASLVAIVWIIFGG